MTKKTKLYFIMLLSTFLGGFFSGSGHMEYGCIFFATTIVIIALFIIFVSDSNDKKN